MRSHDIKVGFPRVIVSLSTIPPRFPYVGKTLSSIVSQSFKPDKIELWIPRSYRRFPNHEFCFPNVPDDVSVEVTDKDLGPATKVLPCVKKYRDTDATIVYVDDDRIYWKHFLKTRLEAAKIRPNECIAAAGCDLNWFDQKISSSDRKRGLFNPNSGRKNSLESESRAHYPRVNRRYGGIKNLAKNVPFWIAREAEFAKNNDQGRRWMIYRQDCGYADIAEGYGGVLVKPSFFDEFAFDTPPVFWAVDDIWLSGCLAIKKIPIWVEKIVVKGGIKKADNFSSTIEPLHRAVIDGSDRWNANRKCIEYFRQKHEIWK